jgi:hypothetical protein
MRQKCKQETRLFQIVSPGHFHLDNTEMQIIASKATILKIGIYTWKNIFLLMTKSSLFLQKSRRRGKI